MSVSAAYSDPNSLVPVLPSERADSAAAAREKSQHLSMFAEGDGSPSFWDLVDVINPLQHIPVINKIYQDLTGDKIGVGARLAGSTLFGGPIGLIASAINCAIEEETGKDAGGHLMALFRDDATGQPATALAEAKPGIVPAEAKPGIVPAEAKPAAPQQVAAAIAAAPVIALPDVPAKANGAGPMMFSSDGNLANRAPGVQAPITHPAPTIQPVAVQPAAKVMPLAGAQNRFMPLPQRTAINPANVPPPISVPVSNSGIRSNVPITGRDPVSNAPSAMAVQKAMAAQGLGGAEHPMLPPAAPTGGANADWFSSMGQALDKYERANNLAAKPAPSQNTLQ